MLFLDSDLGWITDVLRRMTCLWLCTPQKTKRNVVMLPVSVMWFLLTCAGCIIYNFKCNLHSVIYTVSNLSQRYSQSKYCHREVIFRTTGFIVCSLIIPKVHMKLSCSWMLMCLLTCDSSGKRSFSFSVSFDGLHRYLVLCSWIQTCRKIDFELESSSFLYRSLHVLITPKIKEIWIRIFKDLKANTNCSVSILQFAHLVPFSLLYLLPLSVRALSHCRSVYLFWLNTYIDISYH